MEMNREQLSELISAYLDGEVNPREKALVEDALRADPAVGRLLEELRQTAAAVAALPRHTAPPNLAVDLDAQLERAQLLSGFKANAGEIALRKTPWHAPLKAAAMLAVVVGAGWWFLSLQQEHRPDRFAQAPSRDAKELASESNAISPLALKSVPPPLDVESQLAAGADPVVLVKQSFEPEQIRLRVVARDPAERDALSKQFTTQLAQANTENLAHRESSSSKKEPFGAFYLEGKPGINYANPQEKQILVRLPHADAQRIVDDVEASGKIPADHLALQVGPAVVRGPANARGMLQMMAEKDQPAPSKAETPAALADSRDRSSSRGLVNTISEIVGLGPLMKNDPASDKGDRAAVASRDAMGRDGTGAAGDKASESLPVKSAEFKDRVATAEKAESEEKKTESAHDSLVSKRLAAARSKRAEENVNSSRESEALRTQPTADISTLSRGAAAAEQFITMVIEFAVPDSKPPPPSNSSRTRS